MIRAIIKNGAIQLLEPIPPEWTDGREVVVDEAEPVRRSEEVDQWLQELESAAGTIDSADDERLQVAVDEVRRQAKETARREMGSP